MVAFTAVSVISGIVIWFVSQSARRGKTDEQLIAEGLADREIAEGSARPSRRRRREPTAARDGRRPVRSVSSVDAVEPRGTRRRARVVPRRSASSADT